MGHINEIISLVDFVKSYDDNEIAVAIAEHKNKRLSKLTSASHSIYEALLAEWRSRHGKKPVPRVMPESEMVLQKGSSSSCKFILHLL